MSLDRRALRNRILDISMAAGEGHVPSALSILDIVATLYDDVLGVTPANWREPTANQFVLSKGHGCLALYAVLEAKGFIDAEQMERFCQNAGTLGGHPDARKVNGVWASTGSLGHGLGIAVGMAYAKKIAKRAGRVFCLVGDGELQEGSCWEAIRLASELELRNFVLIVDDNSSHDSVQGPSLGRHGFEWTAGYSPERMFAGIRSELHTPAALIVHTVKGAGIAMMQANPAAWHRRTPSGAEYAEMKEGL